MAHVASSVAQETTVQLPPRSLKDRCLKCVPELSRTHTDNQAIKTVVPRPYAAVLGPHTVVTRTIPDGAIIPDHHGCTTSKICRVGLPERK
ncbi:hypothetical protein DPMN_083139 [Dreissena polymorpha]|uniref:Uncharacterized protein n=1 Tax=Dreissena polymorpha TaxID=45954 RepID=A0A9D3YBB8_DREPO|nr:hypothetical protein DPMN_083139 [Dreissena polymorpha]